MSKSQKKSLLRKNYKKAAIYLLVLLSIAWALPNVASSGLLGEQSPSSSEGKNHPTVQNTPAAPNSEAKTLVEIRQAVITKVEKFISRSKRTHIRFEFTVNGKNYKGIFYEGDWNSDHLAALRSGKATLVGYWDTYRGSPSFVAKTARR